MVEPLFFREFEITPEVGKLITLGGSEGKHAASVRRMRQGEAIQLTDGNGLRVRGTVQSVRDKDLDIQIESVSAEQLPLLELVLVQALAKGDRDELAIQAATELGAVAVYPWQAERSISRWDSAKAAKGRARWQLICDEAAKQSLRSNFPKVNELVTSADLVELATAFDQILVLDPTAEVGISRIAKTEGKIALVVGPEGGIDEHELLQLENAGAVRVHLGSGILRTSTAGVAAIAAILAKSGLYQ